MVYKAKDHLFILLWNAVSIRSNFFVHWNLIQNDDILWFDKDPQIDLLSRKGLKFVSKAIPTLAESFHRWWSNRCGNFFLLLLAMLLVSGYLIFMAIFSRKVKQILESFFFFVILNMPWNITRHGSSQISIKYVHLCFVLSQFANF